jgi:hypothetical protein
VSRFSGEKQPAPTLRYRQTRATPARFCTLLYPYAAGEKAEVKLLPVEVKGDFSDASRVVGLRIETATFSDYLLLDRTKTKRRKFFAGYETDAQLVYLRHSQENSRLVKAVLHGGRQLWFQGQPLHLGSAGRSVIDVLSNPGS